MSEVSITPQLGNSIPGYFKDRISNGIKDELYAKALVVESEQKTVVFIVVDAIDLARRDVERIRSRIQEGTGIPQEHIMVSATHTHTGPPVKEGFNSKVNEDYMVWLAQKAGDAGVLAYKGRREARIGFGVGQEANIAFNRRFYMKDGSVTTNPGILNPQIDRPAGPIDPEVIVARIDDAATGEPIGVLTNYACHTDTVSGNEYSADFPGALSRTLKQVLGEKTVSLFMLGACGNINHIDVSGVTPRDGRNHIRMGTILAGEVLKVREKITSLASELAIDVKQSFFDVEYRSPTDREVQLAELAEQNASTASDMELAFARQVRGIQAAGPGSTNVEIQSVRLGELGIVGLPAEIFVEFGLRIKSRSPFPITLINELCNGSARGYICVKEAYNQGGYEPRTTNNSKLATDAGDRFVEKAVELLHQFEQVPAK